MIIIVAGAEIKKTSPAGGVVEYSVPFIVRSSIRMKEKKITIKM